MTVLENREEPAHAAQDVWLRIAMWRVENIHTQGWEEMMDEMDKQGDLLITQMKTNLQTLFMYVSSSPE